MVQAAAAPLVLSGVDLPTAVPGRPGRARAGLGRGPVLAVLSRAALVLGSAVVLGLVLTSRSGPACLLRAATGLPCPLCGGTTAAVAAGRLDLRGALAASPLAVLGAAALVLAPLSPARLRAALARRRTPVVLSALAAGEAWQLIRLVSSPLPGGPA